MATTKQASKKVVSNNDFTSEYKTVEIALSTAIVGKAIGHNAERASASLVMQGGEVPSFDVVKASCQGTIVVKDSSIKATLSTLKTLAFLGKVIPASEVKFIAGSAIGGRVSDIKKLADTIISANGGKYTTDGRTKERKWTVKPKKIVTGATEKALNTPKPETTKTEVSHKLALVALIDKAIQTLSLVDEIDDTLKALAGKNLADALLRIKA